MFISLYVFPFFFFFFLYFIYSILFIYLFIFLGGAKNYKKILGNFKFCGNSFQNKLPVPQLGLWPSPSSSDFTQLSPKGGNMARIRSQKIQTRAETRRVNRRPCSLSVTSSFCVDCLAVLVCLYERLSQDALVNSTCRSVLHRTYFCPLDTIRRFSRRLVSE